MSLLPKDGAAASFRAVVEGLGWTLPLHLNSLASRNSGAGESTLIFLVSWDFPCFLGFSLFQRRRSLILGNSSIKGKLGHLGTPFWSEKVWNYFSLENSARQPFAAGECDAISPSGCVYICICVCVCVLCECVCLCTESTITIHSSCVLQSHIRHWVSKHGSTVSKGNTGVASQKPPATYFHQLINT